MGSVKQYKFDTDIVLYALGDLHRGDDACDVSMYLKMVDRIKKTPNAYWVSTGDMLNVALPNSKSSTFDSSNLGEEVEALSTEMAPIADKCLGFVGSNHHGRFDRAVGMSLDRMLAKFLDIPYLGDLGKIIVTCGRVSHWIGLHHTTGGAGTDGAKANKQTKLMNLLPCMDLYLAGHTHSYMAVPECQFYPDRKRGLLTQLRQLKVTTGHYLDYDSSYAASLGLTPKPKGSAVVHLPFSNIGNMTEKNYKSWLED